MKKVEYFSSNIFTHPDFGNLTVLEFDGSQRYKKRKSTARKNLVCELPFL